MHNRFSYYGVNRCSDLSNMKIKKGRSGIEKFNVGEHGIIVI